jgi:hypothetical protein
MKQKSWVVTFIFFIFLSLLTKNQAQNLSKTYTIQWEKPVIHQKEDETELKLLFFKDAILKSEFPTLPVYADKINVAANYTSYQYTISNVVVESFTGEELSLIPSSFSQKEIKIEIVTAASKKQNYALITFIPIIYSGNTPQKVVSFKLDIDPTAPIAFKSYKGVANSVLASGNWYKIGVVNSGIYKVTYDDLITLGISSGALSSSNIALFGNGGSILPEANSVNRPSDLVENSIWIHDGGDGMINSGDYFLFYGKGIHSWDIDSSNETFSHTFNVYADKTYYYITIDPSIGVKKRILQVDNSGLSENTTINTFTHYDFYENDKYNFAESGRQWFDEGFELENTKSYTFGIPEPMGTPARITFVAGTTISQSSSFSISVNGNSLSNMPLSGAGSGSFGAFNFKSYSVTNPTAPLQINMTYNKPQSSSIAYVDYIEIQLDCNLKFYKDQFPFCSPQSVGVENISLFQISNANSATKVWDVSNPYEPAQMIGTLSNGVFSFKSNTGSLKYFQAFNGNSYLSVSTIGKISNQNLIGTSDVDMIIISHTDFISEANRHAQLRRNSEGITVLVVTPEQVYNEFSSGTQDPTAIRDYMRAVYKKSDGAYPKYLLLFGRPSYDYRGRVSGTKMYVPNYQVYESLSENNLRANDDYFGVLDDNEGVSGMGLIDIGIGRFPVTTLAQATICVNKTANYTSKQNLVTGNSTVVSNYSDWRNIITFVGDDEEDNFHMKTVDAGAIKVSARYPHFNLDKIYCDAYEQVSYAGGQRYPEVNKAINNRMERGSLIFAYAGHGGANGLGHERFVEISDINKWSNKYNQPWMFNFTCSFGWIDRKSISPSELIFINDKGGASAMLTTTRVAFAGPNYNFCEYLFDVPFIDENNNVITIGDLNKEGKNRSGNNENLRMFVVLGDPSLKLNFPVYNVLTDSINGFSTSQTLDTIRALEKVTIKGHITNLDGNILTQFNGNLYPSIYDKAMKFTTLMNDPDRVDGPFEFDLQKSIIFKGNASVTNGYFEFSFIVPKDINYSYGNGKLSYYVKSQNTDGKGFFSDFIIGGTSSNPISDEKGPEIQIFLNDEKFVNGGITNPNPQLIVKLKDDNGINTTGNGIGHDLIAIIDENTDSQVILNDYYQAEKDSFNTGIVRYPMSDLTSGSHTLKIRAWDIANNVSESTLDFIVMNDEELSIDHVLNYPNPFTTHTEFFFEHNQPGQSFDIMVQIFTISGKLVKTIHSTQYLDGTRSDGIEWNGLDDFGDKLAKGTYVYKIMVRNSENETVEKFEKIVIL